MCEALSSAFDFWRKREPKLRVRMCGILFARPQTQLANQEIMPEIEYFDERTGCHIHLFVAGCYRSDLDRTFFPNGRLFPDGRPVGRTGRWQYSDAAFNVFRKDIEDRTAWRYNDGVELLLFNATYDAAKYAVLADFSTCIRVDLQKARSLGAVQSVAELIGQLARFCESSQSDDPTWGFSDSVGLRVAGSSLWQVIVGLLPKGLQSGAESARLFVTADLGRHNA
jgi:hypothetical protein